MTTGLGRLLRRLFFREISRVREGGRLVLDFEFSSEPTRQTELELEVGSVDAARKPQE